MKAVVVHDIRQARVEEVDEPQVVPGSLKVRVEACAICGSDVRIFTKGDHRASFSYWQYVAKGLIILMAVYIDMQRNKKSRA